MKYLLEDTLSLLDETTLIDTIYSRKDLKIRREVLKETVNSILLNSDFFYKKAASNLADWQRKFLNQNDNINKKTSIEVFSGDWGEITKILTKKYGYCFAVLNMANAHVPGGGYLEGLVAQEENMFRRTDCHFSINVNTLDENGYYLKEYTDLINGENNVVYLDYENPRICIRGQEFKNREDLGYRWLSEDEIFPFYEMRSAAIDLRTGVKFSEKECVKRVRAQFNTLKKYKIKHVVLGAHGCGAFLNPPEKVANVYRKVIKEFTDDFKVIAFAIFNAGYGPDNYSVFRNILETSKNS